MIISTCQKHTAFASVQKVSDFGENEFRVISLFNLPVCSYY